MAIPKKQSGLPQRYPSVVTRNYGDYYYKFQKQFLNALIFKPVRFGVNHRNLQRVVVRTLKQTC